MTTTPCFTKIGMVFATSHRDFTWNTAIVLTENPSEQDFLTEFCQRHALNEIFRTNADTFFYPYAERIAASATARSSPLIVGLNGAQGSGKSTLSQYLSEVLPRFFGVDCHVVSIDDFYLSKARRRKLGQAVHPLLAIRGVPGTHDTKQLYDVLSVCSDGSARAVSLPVFDKLADDRTKEVRSIQLGAKPTVVLFEGWCVGTPPQETLALSVPVGSFEFVNDNSGVWRQYVNEQLAGVYATLFEKIDHLSLLRPPCFEAVFDWRVDQEVRLIAQRRSETMCETRPGMTVKQVGEFVENFRRLTCHAMAVLPALANETWELQADRRILEEVAIA